MSIEHEEERAFGEDFMALPKDLPLGPKAMMLLCIRRAKLLLDRASRETEQAVVVDEDAMERFEALREGVEHDLTLMFAEVLEGISARRRRRRAKR